MFTSLLMWTTLRMFREGNVYPPRAANVKESEPRGPLLNRCRLPSVTAEHAPCLAEGWS